MSVGIRGWLPTSRVVGLGCCRFDQGVVDGMQVACLFYGFLAVPLIGGGGVKQAHYVGALLGPGLSSVKFWNHCTIRRYVFQEPNPWSNPEGKPQGCDVSNGFKVVLTKGSTRPTVLNMACVFAERPLRSSLAL